MRKLTLTFVLFIAAFSQALADRTAHYLMPMAVQQGRDAEVILHGNRLQNIEQILFWDEGITWLGSEPVNEVRDQHYEKMNPAREGTAARLKFRIADDCRVGRHYFRIRTDETLSELQSLWVSPYPCVEESQPFSDSDKKTNGDFEHAQAVKLGTTVYGYSLRYRLQDHDFFKVEMEAGRRLTVEMWSDCLNFFGNSDYAMAVYGPDRKRLAFSDNTDLTRRDSWLSLKVPKNGTYYIDIHKSHEAENNPWHYIAHITGGVRPALTYPLGGQAGTTPAVQLMGGGADLEAKIQMPTQPGRFEDSMIEYRPGEAVLPNRIQVADFPNVLEDGGEHFTPATAQVYSGQLPIAFNGIVEHEGKLDWFRFTARKGERYRIRSYSARLGSPLDPIITIQPAPGTESRINETVDDSTFHMHDLADNKRLAHSMKMDPVTIFEPEVDGDYLLGIGDSQFLAGPHHVYRVEIQPVIDQAFIRVTRDYREAPSKREAFVVPRGSTMERTMSFSIPVGSRYRGEVEFLAEGLPPGVTMQCAPANVGNGWIQLIFTADRNAKPWAGFIDLKMRPTDREGSDFAGEYLFHRVADGGRGGYGDSFFLYRKCPLAVVEPAPFAVRVLEPKAPLMKKASLDVEVEVERREGFSGPVRLTCYWTPAGITAGAPVDLAAEESRARFSLSADDRAQVGSFPLSITVQQALDNSPDERGARSNGHGTGYHYVSSPPVAIQVAEPYLEITFERTAIKQEADGELVAAIKELRPLPGKAQARLLLLPQGMEAKGSMTIRPGDKEVRFPVKVTKDCLTGQHQNITCEIAVEVDGQLIKQTSGNAVVRIDEAKK